MSNGKSPSLTWGGVLLAISVVTGQFVNLAVEYLTADRVTLPATAEGALSGSNEAVLRYDGDTDQIVASVNGGAYGPLAGGGIEGSGSNNAIVKWTGEDSVGESIISDDGTGVTVNGTGLAVSDGGTEQAFAIYVTETETQLAATGDLKLSAPAGEVLIDSVDLTIDAGDLNVSAGDINAVGGNLDLDADLRLGYLASGQGYLASTHGFNAEYRFLEFGASEPADFTNVSNTAGKDVYFKAQSGGAHTSGNPAGGSFIFEPGAKGAGGSGADGALIVRQPGGVAGTDEMRLSHNGTEGTVEAIDGNLVLKAEDSVILRATTSGGGVLLDLNAAMTPNTANATDLGATTNEFRALYLGEDTSSGMYWGLDQDVRAWFDEASTDDFFITTAGANDIIVKPGSGGVFSVQEPGGTDTLDFYSDGSSSIINSPQNVLSMRVAGGERAQLTSTAFRVMHQLRQNSLVGQTASTTQTQGQGAIAANINIFEVSVCANANDTVTLPSSPAAGIILWVINNGAQTLQIFPASGDNLGSGTNASTTLAAGGRMIFVAIDGDNWVRGW